MAAVVAHGVPERQADEPGADEARHRLGDVHDRLQEHDHAERDDRVERAVLEVAVLGERALARPA